MRYRSRVIAIYTLLFSWFLGPLSVIPEGRLQAAVNDSMNQRQGAAVALDVETGQVLASYRMDVAARRRAAPGSTMKPFTMMALLEAGLVTSETALFCPRTVRVAGHNLDCSHQRLPGPLDPIMALAYSCNHFFVTMSKGLSTNILTQEFSRAGFNSLTGKWPTEIAGTVEPPRSSQSIQLMAIGEEGVLVTPLALAEAYRSLVRPLRTPATTTPELRLVSEGLQAAVQIGTAQRAASKHVVIAGKTGTAGGHGWFAGFAPAKHPEIVIVVFIEKGTGGSDAAPLAGRIFDSYYAKAIR